MRPSNVRETALDLLMKIEKNQAYSHLLIHSAARERRLNAKDLSLLTRIVYGTVQRKNTLDFMLDRFLKKEPERWVRVLLRLSLYQLSELDRVPDRAVLHEAVEIAKRRGHRGIAGLVNGVLRAYQRNGEVDFAVIHDPLDRLAIETSHPRWLLEQWMNDYDRDTVANICEANNELPNVTVRTNTLRTTRESLMRTLREEGVTVEEGALAPEAVVVKSGAVQQAESFAAGLLTIQDEASMLAAHALDVKPGMRVLDTCAAPGGKTTHLAQLMNDEGEIVALDIHNHKVKLIEQLAARLGVKSIHAANLDGRLAAESFGRETFDRILIDAPCSGFGVIRRKPDIKWSKRPEDVERLASIQGDILASVAPLVKPGGTLVYSTCTIERKENEQVVRDFLRNHADFTFDRTLCERMPERLRLSEDKGMVQILPHEAGTDGFFIAALQKQGVS
ncbi:MAG TPA: 16S rRNA (cytosine(967)-C(5))-methyltransferase RsmB [Bacillales bacterium]|nr:16S rRNA (cytosine(967)-C(5))-methyltransferase RsmB [Bacillales bacterium]